MLKRSLYIYFLLCFEISFALAQDGKSDNLIYWSATRKLGVDDFIKKKDARSSYAQFSFDYEINGFDFLTKNFNNKVKSYMIESASWIDTTANLDEHIRYQQTLFDISEIYARKFRKALKDNRKKIAGGIYFIQELNAKIMTVFSSRRMEYDNETYFGQDPDKQVKWETLIKKELQELKEYERKE